MHTRKEDLLHEALDFHAFCSSVAISHQEFLKETCLVSCRGAGTDANVFIELFGSNGTVGKTRLETSANNYERNSVSSFIIVSFHVQEAWSVKQDGLGAVDCCDRTSTTNACIQWHILCVEQIARPQHHDTPCHFPAFLCLASSTRLTCLWSKEQTLGMWNV